MNDVQPASHFPDSFHQRSVHMHRQIEIELGRYRHLFKFADDGYLITDSNGIITEANLAIVQLLNIKLEHLIGKPIAVFLSLPDRTVLRTNILKISQDLEHAPIAWETTLKPRSKLAISVDLRVAHLKFPGRPSQLWWCIHDTTQRKMLEQTLNNEQRRLQTLSQSIIETQETERRHLASELHDEIGQLLTGLKLSLEYSNAQELVADPNIVDALSVVDQLISQIRDLSIQLRPPTLDLLGLATTLRWYFDRYTKQTQIAVHFKCNDTQQRYPAHVEIAAYRVIQEALTNIARHAQVKEAFVRINAGVDSLCIEIEDFGAGFDYEQAKRDPLHRGLAGMQERIALLGSHLNIYTAVGQGTKITMEVNLV